MPNKAKCRWTSPARTCVRRLTTREGNCCYSDMVAQQGCSPRSTWYRQARLWAPAGSFRPIIPCALQMANESLPARCHFEQSYDHLDLPPPATRCPGLCEGLAANQTLTISLSLDFLGTMRDISLSPSTDCPGWRELCHSIATHHSTAHHQSHVSTCLSWK